MLVTKLGESLQNLLHFDWDLGLVELDEQWREASSFFVLMGVYARLLDPLRAQLETLRGGAWVPISKETEKHVFGD